MYSDVDVAFLHFTGTLYELLPTRSELQSYSLYESSLAAAILTLLSPRGLRIGRRFRGASPVYPTPRNREIGFVSSSFSFRAVRVSGAGEAVLAHVERYP